VPEDRLAVLEERVAALERLVAELRAAKRPATSAAPDPKDPLKDHPLFRQSITDPKELAEHHAQVLKALGIEHVKPVGAQKVREMMIADGVDPDDNEFSRGIIEAREE
jgi:hypothetical protein